MSARGRAPSGDKTTAVAVYEAEHAVRRLTGHGTLQPVYGSPRMTSRGYGRVPRTYKLPDDAPGLMTPRACRDLVELATREYGVRADRLTVKMTTGRTTGVCKIRGNGLAWPGVTYEVQLPPWTRFYAPVLHEAAHVVGHHACSTMGHGPIWRASFLELLRRFGPVGASALYGDAFRAAGLPCDPTISSHLADLAARTTERTTS